MTKDQSKRINPYDKHRAWFLVNAKLRNIAKNCLSVYPKAFEMKDYVVAFALAKAFKTHGAAIYLCKKSFGEDAGILIRTLFELDVLVGYSLADSTDETATLFIEYESIDREKMYNANDKSEIRDMMKQKKNYQEIINKVLANSKSAKQNPGRLGKNNKPQVATWSGKNYEDMAKVAKLDDSYNIAYRLFSQLTHSSPRVVHWYLEEVTEDEKIRSKAYPTDNYIEECLVKSFDFLYDIVYAYNKRYSCKQDQNIAQLLQRYINLL